MYSLPGLYVAVIVEIIPPNSAKSQTKYQYEYQVSLTLDGYIQQQYRCITSDGYLGAVYDFEDRVLDVNSRILVMFPNGIPTLGVIIGALRRAKIAPKMEGSGPRYLKHFRNTEQEITSNGELYLRTLSQDTGPTASEISLSRENLKLTSNKDNSNNYINLDDASNKITIKAYNLEITVEKDKTVTIGGDAKIKASGNIVIECADATIKAKKLNANISGSAEIKVSNNATIDAKKISLAGQEGQVLTTATQPTCYVTGLPFKGSSKIFAGS